MYYIKIMLSFYKKLLFSHLSFSVVGPEWAAQELQSENVNTPSELQELRDYAQQLAKDGVDNSDISLLLEEIDAQRDAITAETRSWEKDLLVSMLKKLGWELAQWSSKGLFQKKLLSGRVVYDSYDGFGWTEAQAVSKRTVAKLIEKLWFSRQEIITALWDGNSEYAQMLLAWEAQRWPNKNQIAEMWEIRKNQEKENQIQDEDMVMSQNIDSQRATRDVAVAKDEAMRSKNIHPDTVDISEFADSDLIHIEPQVVPLAWENTETQTENTQSIIYLQNLLTEKWETLSYKQDVLADPDTISAIQDCLVEQVWIKKIQEILWRPDMTSEKFVDGVFGWWTDAVTRWYQNKNSLVVDGDPGYNTIMSLVRTKDTQNNLHA